VVHLTDRFDADQGDADQGDADQGDADRGDGDQHEGGADRHVATVLAEAVPGVVRATVARAGEGDGA
jgi:hypothetical protein